MRFPGGGGAICWYCGRPFVWGGNGVTGHLMCTGSRERCCWNSFGIDGALVCRRVKEVITKQLFALDGFDEHYRLLVEDARRHKGGDLPQRKAKLARDEEDLAHQQRNVGDAIGKLGLNDVLEKKMGELAAEEKRLARERQELKRLETDKLDVPETVADLRRQIEVSFLDLAHNSPEFADLLKKLVPNFHVYLLRLIDGGHPLPRARISLHLDGLVPDASRVAGLPEILHHDVTIDLFEAPPQREAIRQEAVALTGQNLDQREVARRLKVTQTAVSDALQLHKMMLERQLTSPYVILEGPPNDYTKLRRHLHPQYQFRPLEGYERPAL